MYIKNNKYGLIAQTGLMARKKKISSSKPTASLPLFLYWSH